ncbi:MAG: hypothetical protein PVJ20_13995 [Desulfobacterales bacterium]
MKLKCPQNNNHKQFIRESYDTRGNRVNIEVVDEYGRFMGEQLDLYTGDVRYEYFCLQCKVPVKEEGNNSKHKM